MTAFFSKSFFSLSSACGLLMISGFSLAESSMRMYSAPAKIHLNNGNHKIIRLLRVNLSEEDRKILLKRISFTLKKTKYPLKKISNLPPTIENGMGGVPVFDQGAWGTCATFATTAVLDALYGLTGGQSISQLCNLELGRSIKNPNEAGGWQGSFGYLVLQQIAQYGYIPQSYQNTVGCGGLKKYPVNNPYNNGYAMPVDLFIQNSVKSFSANDWASLLSVPQGPGLLTEERGEKILNHVKNHLVKGHRVLLSLFLDPEKGDAGAIGEFHGIRNDVWLLTNTIQEDIKKGIIAGHALVITGYDDNACAKFTENYSQSAIVKQQCGILHLRNSWSSFAGDNGDYYMTYDYFKTMALEAYAIGQGVHSAF